MFGRGRELRELRAAVALCSDKHASFGTLAEELAERVTAKSQELGLDAAVTAAMEELTDEQLKTQLLEMFRELPPEKQAELFLKYLPDDVIHAGLKSQRERLRRLANPGLAIDQIIADARRTQQLELWQLPENTRLEVWLYRYSSIAGSTPAEILNKDMDRRILVVRDKDMFLGLQDGRNPSLWGCDYVIPLNGLFSLGTLRRVNAKERTLAYKLVFGGEVHVWHNKDLLSLSMLEKNGKSLSVYVGRCQLNGREVFCTQPGTSDE